MRAWCALAKTKINIPETNSNYSLKESKPSACEVAGITSRINAQDHTDDIRYPVVDVGAAVEAGLYKFNGTAEGARADEDRQQSDAARVRQWEGECGEGDEVYQLVATSGAGGGASMGESIATVRVSVIIVVRWMSRYLRIRLRGSGVMRKRKCRLPLGVFAAK